MPWPLNQYGAPAASRTLVAGCVASGTASGGAGWPFFGKLIRWNPAIVNFTLSPAWTLTADGKNWLMSPSLGTPAGVFLMGGPANTFLVAAEAAPGTARLTITAANANLDLLCTNDSQLAGLEELAGRFTSSRAGRRASNLRGSEEWVKGGCPYIREIPGELGAFG